MARVTWVGNSGTQGQVKTWTMTSSVTSGSVWTFSITDENGNVYSGLTHTTSASPSIANVCTGLAATWNASASPLASGITASSTSTTIIATADTAGVPFTVSLAATSGGTVSSADTTANKGPNHWKTAENWDNYTVPTASDSPIISGTVSILYGLDTSASHDEVEVRDYSGVIGGTHGGYLKITTSALTYDGTGADSRIDLEASTVAPLIYGTGSAPTNGYGLRIKGTALDGIDVESGNVGVGVDGDDITTEVDAVNVKGGVFTLGDGVTTTTSVSDGIVVNQSGGTVYTEASLKRVKMTNSATMYLRGAAATTSSVVVSENCKLNWDSNGTIASIVVHSGGELLNDKDLTSKSVTSATFYNGSKISDPLKKVTWPTSGNGSLQFPTGLDNCDLNLGQGVKFIPVST